MLKYKDQKGEILFLSLVQVTKIINNKFVVSCDINWETTLSKDRKKAINPGLLF